MIIRCHFLVPRKRAPALILTRSGIESAQDVKDGIYIEFILRTKRSGVLNQVGSNNII